MKNFEWKSFWKAFLIFLVIFTLIMIPINFALNKLGGVRLFAGTENIMKDMGYVINPDSPFYQEFTDSERVNILMLGVNDGLTDTIMLGSYDLKNQRVDVISVPRDTYYYREGYKSPAAHKINAIFGKNGAVGTAEAVSEVLLGIPINYYVVVSYDAVEKVVESMGGVPMDIPNISHKGGMYYNDPYDTPPLKIAIPEGEQVLDGEHAVQYLRFRKGYPEGDIGRVKAQQTFIKAAFKQALGKDLVAVVKTTLENVESDIPLGMSVKLATKGLSLDAEDMTTYLAPGGSGTTNGASYWRVDEQAVAEMIEQIYNPPEEEENTDGGEEE